jgi:type 1 fimbriae regulatory protein FimB/type 1 fimbriae regulatory protein FimE
LTAYIARRPREYLTAKEAGLLIEMARDRGRYGHRDATMILIAFAEVHPVGGTEIRAMRRLKRMEIDFGRPPRIGAVAA